MSAAESDAAYLRRVRRWMESHPAGKSVAVSRDLVLRLVELAERPLPPSDGSTQ